MARSSAPASSMTFDTSIKVEVSRLKMKRSAAVDYIDTAKLAKAAKAEFEVGHVIVKGSKKPVLAIVKKGMVVGLKMGECEGCSDAAPTKEVRALLRTASNKLDGGVTKVPPAPIPVEVFVSRQANIEISHCFLVCLPFTNFCWVCCECCSVAEDGRGCVLLGAHAAVA